MRITGSIIAAAILTTGLSACGSPKDDSTATPTEEATTTATAETATAASGAKPASFAQCAACHSVEPGKHGIGPSLAGIYGTKAGDIAGYSFSEPLKASGLTWDDATLDKWLAGPMKLVPGTKMTYAGLQDEAKRQELIAYLKTLK